MKTTYTLIISAMYINENDIYFNYLCYVYFCIQDKYIKYNRQTYIQ
jgi:hypothetical protein